MKRFIAFVLFVALIGLSLVAWQADAQTMFEYYTGGTSVTGVDPGWCYAQSFTASEAAEFEVGTFAATNVGGTATGQLHAELWAASAGAPTGSVLDTSDNVYDVSTLRTYNGTQGASILFFYFNTPITLTDTSQYALILEYESGGSGEIRVTQDTAGSYAGGNLAYANGCSSWTEIEATDINFVAHGNVPGAGGESTTTTASTTISYVQNETQDIAFGILIFLILFFGLLFYFKR